MEKRERKLCASQQATAAFIRKSVNYDASKPVNIFQLRDIRYFNRDGFEGDGVCEAKHMK